MFIRSRFLIIAVIVAGVAVGEVAAAEMPAAPKMPSMPSTKGGGQAQQPTPEQQKQMQKARYQRSQKLRKGNTPEKSGEKNKDDAEIVIVGPIVQGTPSPGQPLVFSITDGEGKNHILKGREATLRKLVGKTAEVIAEIDEKDAGVLKVKSAHEAKGEPTADEGDKKKAAKSS